MKTISDELKAHLAGDVLSIAHCIRLVRTDAVVMGFTDHDEDITYDAVTYESSAAHNLTSITASANLSVDKTDMETFLDSSYITYDDLRNGVWDYAKWYLFLVNWKDLTQGKLDLAWGWLGKVEAGRHRFFCEASTVFQALDQTLLELVGPGCRANLGDDRCGVNIDDFTETGTVTAVTSNQVFRDENRTEAIRTFAGGLLTWTNTSGNNAGTQMEVKKYAANGTFTLFKSMSGDIQVGDTYSVTYGCNKSFATCKDVFDNVVNFRGEPHLPGTGRMIQYGKKSSIT